MKESATFLTLRIPDFDAVIRKAVDNRLAGRPVVVVTAFKPVGRVLAACPVARTHGVREEMHYPLARIACPEAVFSLPDNQLAADAMRRLLRTAGRYSPLVEPAGAGCVLLDTWGTERLWGDNCQVAESLRQDVLALRLPAAAGLAVCRPWSLLASRVAGEGGVCHVPPGREDSFLEQVPAGWVDGLTPHTRALLLEMNIRTLGQLRSFERVELRRQFGKECGEALWNAISPQPWDTVSLLPEQALLDMDDNRIRVGAALEEATVAAERMRVVVRSLTTRIAASLRTRDLGAARLRLTLFHADGALKSAAARTGGFIQDEATLNAVAEQLLGRVFARRVRVFRLWLDAEKLAEPQRQGVLFPLRTADEKSLPSETERREAAVLLATMDRINERYGDAAVGSGTLLTAKRVRRRRAVKGITQQRKSAGIMGT